jgi:hypothetical protein
MQVVKYEASKRTLSPTRLNSWATDLLEELNDETAATNWKDVAIALAVVTGRRIYSEILCGVGQYEDLGDQQISFTGVAKGKEHNPDSFVIPTLCSSALVVKAVAWLDLKGKRVQCDNPHDWVQVKLAREKADKRYAKDVALYWKTRLCPRLLGLEASDDNNEFVKIHGLRKLYVMQFIQGLSDRQARTKAASLLCHSSDGSVASDAYTSQYELVTEAYEPNDTSCDASLGA